MKEMMEFTPVIVNQVIIIRAGSINDLLILKFF